MRISDWSSDVCSSDLDTLTPDLVLDAVESIGYLSDARVLALNSYENRVYQVGIEDETPLIAKFYRPGRWSDAAILEEHQFSQIGRASCRERVCQSVSISVGRGYLKKTHTTKKY